MENYEITQQNGNWHVEGFPDAVALVEINDIPRARRLGHLVLHMADLQFAGVLAQRIVDEVDQDPTLRRAVWHASVVHYCKCFGKSGKRGQISADAIFRDPEAMDAHRFILALRNRHLVHDENSYSQAIVGAVVNHAEATSNIAKILTLATVADTTDPGMAQNLINLVVLAIGYIEKQVDSISDYLTEQLNRERRGDLLARPSVSYTPPTPQDM